MKKILYILDTFETGGAEKKYPTEHKGKIVDLLGKTKLSSNHFFFKPEINFVKEIQAISTSFVNNQYDNVLVKLKDEFRSHLIKAIK